jgi:hypothetical protein
MVVGALFVRIISTHAGHNAIIIMPFLATILQKSRFFEIKINWQIYNL